MTRAILIGGAILAFIGLAIYVGVKLFDARDRTADVRGGRQLSHEEMMADPIKANEDRAVAVVEKLGGHVVRSERDVDFQPVVGASLRDCPVNDSDLKEIAGLARIFDIDLSGTRVTDEGLKELDAFRLLTSVDLSRTGLTGNGLIHLKELIALTKLSLAGTAVTDAGLAGLQGVPALRDLDLSTTAVTNAVLAHLKTLTGLTNLNLAGTKVTGQAATSLASLGLRTIDVSGMPLTADEYMILRDAVSPGPAPAPGGPGQTIEEKLTVRWSRNSLSDEWLAALAAKGRLELLVDSTANAKSKLKALRVLNLSDSKVTDAGLKSLKGRNDFDALDLKRTAITDAGLTELQGMSHLQMVDLTKTKATDAGVAELKAALPKCQVKH
jgi:internalin A